MREKKLVLLTENCDPRPPNCPTGSQGKLNHLIGLLLQNITKVQQRNKQRKGSQDYMPQQNLQTKHQETILITVMKRPG